MTPHLLIVTATVDSQVEDAWNRWYDETHLPEIVACPGFRSGQRYVTTAADGSRRYVAIYEVDGPEAILGPQFQARRGWAEFSGRVRWETQLFSRLAVIAGRKV